MKNEVGELANSDVVYVLIENHRRFQAFLKSKVQSAEDAEDILQSAYLKAAEKADSIRDDERVVAWFYRLLRNAIIDYYRRKGTEKKAIEKIGQLTDSLMSDPELDRVVCACLYDLIPTLKPEYANLLQQVDIGGGNVTDAAAALGISTNNAHVRLHRARISLQGRLVQTCGTCSTHGCLDCTCKSTIEL